MKLKIRNLIAAGAIALTGITCVTGFTSINAEAATTNKWINKNGSWYFYKNGRMQKGWKYFTSADGEKAPHWSYFGNDGKLRTYWKHMGTKEHPDGNQPAHWSYFGWNGWLRTGWQWMGTKTNPDGGKPVHVSYFGNNGWLRTGWQRMGTPSNPDGNAPQHWSYFGWDGWLRTGWQSMGRGTGNAFGENTAKHISFFGANGWLRTGLIHFKSNSYNSDGKSKDHKSYFGGNGWLRTNTTFTLSNIKYKADSRGWLTQIAVFATGVKLNKTSVTVDASKTTALTATVSPSNTTNKSIAWTSSNTSIATVSGGKITGKKAGTATITAKTSNGKTATCKVTVKATNSSSSGSSSSSGGNTSGGNTSTTVNATGVSVTYNGKTSYNFDYSKEKITRKTIQLVANVTPSNATNKKVTWKSDDKAGAEVDNNGRVTIKWNYVPRTVKITATTHNGKTATFTIKTDDSIVPR